MFVGAPEELAVAGVVVGEMGAGIKAVELGEGTVMVAAVVDVAAKVVLVGLQVATEMSLITVVVVGMVVALVSVGVAVGDGVV